MNHVRPLLVAFVLSSSTAMALALGCSTEKENGAGSTEDLVGSSDLVISQVWGGGGNSHAAYTHDYVELFNRGKKPVSLGGKSLQYATSLTAFKTDDRIVTLPDVTLEPGHYFLIQLGGTTDSKDATMKALPEADLTSDFGISTDKGKFVLSMTPLACGSSAVPCEEGAWLDLVGYGKVSLSEGKPAAANKTELAALRKGGGCVDTGDNMTDFEGLAPTPRNSSWPAAACTEAARTDAATHTPDAAPSTDASTGRIVDASSEASAPADASTPEPADATAPRPDAAAPRPDAGGTPPATKKEAGATDSGTEPDESEGDEDEDEGDDDASASTSSSGGSITKKPSNAAAPQATNSRSDCAMSPGRTSTGGGGLAAIGGLCLALVSLGRRRNRSAR